MSRTLRRLARFIAATLVFGVSLQARADIGVPMVAIFLPPMWLSLIPVVLLEAWILRRMLSIPSRAALAASAVGNVVTTIVGIPLVWIALAAIELACCGGAAGLDTAARRIYAVTIQAPWLIPYETALGWMIPCALAVLLIPFFVLTVAIEGFVNRRVLAGVDSRKTWRATWIANAWSYLLIFALAWPAFAIASRLPRFFSPLAEWFVAVVFGAAKVLHGR